VFEAFEDYPIGDPPDDVASLDLFLVRRHERASTSNLAKASSTLRMLKRMASFGG
jgi:hypothetical protein